MRSAAIGSYQRRDESRLRYMAGRRSLSPTAIHPFGTCAYCDYSNEVLGIAVDRSYLDLFESYGGFSFALDGVCFVSERPCIVNRDDHGRLHSESGPSLTYPSGWGVWHWHGVQVPDYVILRPQEITIERIACERNAEKCAA